MVYRYRLPVFMAAVQGRPTPLGRYSLQREHDENRWVTNRDQQQRQSCPGVLDGQNLEWAVQASEIAGRVKWLMKIVFEKK